MRINKVSTFEKLTLFFKTSELPVGIEIVLLSGVVFTLGYVMYKYSLDYNKNENEYDGRAKPSKDD